jgi:hypothetical protein
VFAAAASITDAELNLMTHALGWADLLNLGGRRRLRAAERPAIPPWRNRWVGESDDWERLCARGLAVRRSPAHLGCASYGVTALGMQAAEARWQFAEATVRRARQAEVVERRARRAAKAAGVAR